MAAPTSPATGAVLGLLPRAAAASGGSSNSPPSPRPLWRSVTQGRREDGTSSPERPSWRVSYGGRAPGQPLPAGSGIPDGPIPVRRLRRDGKTTSSAPRLAVLLSSGERPGGSRSPSPTSRSIRCGSASFGTPSRTDVVSVYANGPLVGLRRRRHPGHPLNLQLSSDSRSSRSRTSTAMAAPTSLMPRWDRRRRLSNGATPWRALAFPLPEGIPRDAVSAASLPAAQACRRLPFATEPSSSSSRYSLSRAAGRPSLPGRSRTCSKKRPPVMRRRNAGPHPLAGVSLVGKAGKQLLLRRGRVGLGGSGPSVPDLCAVPEPQGVTAPDPGDDARADPTRVGRTAAGPRPPATATRWRCRPRREGFPTGR
jgi:hypothetical protein